MTNLTILAFENAKSIGKPINFNQASQCDVVKGIHELKFMIEGMDQHFRYLSLKPILFQHTCNQYLCLLLPLLFLFCYFFNYQWWRSTINLNDLGKCWRNNAPHFKSRSSHMRRKATAINHFANYMPFNKFL